MIDWIGLIKSRAFTNFDSDIQTVLCPYGKTYHSSPKYWVYRDMKKWKEDHFLHREQYTSTTVYATRTTVYTVQYAYWYGLRRNKNIFLSISKIFTKNLCYLKLWYVILCHIMLYYLISSTIIICTYYYLFSFFHNCFTVTIVSFLISLFSTLLYPSL